MISLPSWTETEHFRFRRDPYGHICLYSLPETNRELPLSLGDYDALAKVSDVTVAFEAKAVKDSYVRNLVYKRDRKSSYFKALEELQENDKIGYAVLLPSDLVDPRSTVQKNFLSRGGHIISLARTLAQFKSDAYRVFGKQIM